MDYLYKRIVKLLQNYSELQRNYTVNWWSMIHRN